MAHVKETSSPINTGTKTTPLPVTIKNSSSTTEKTKEPIIRFFFIAVNRLKSINMDCNLLSFLGVLLPRLIYEW